MGEKAIRFGTIDDVMCTVRGRCDSHSSMREKAPFKDGLASWRDGYLRRVKTERWWLWEGFCATIIAKRLLGKKFLSGGAPSWGKAPPKFFLFVQTLCYNNRKEIIGEEISVFLGEDKGEKGPAPF